MNYAELAETLEDNAWVVEKDLSHPIAFNLREAAAALREAEALRALLGRARPHVADSIGANAPELLARIDAALRGKE